MERRLPWVGCRTSTIPCVKRTTVARLHSRPHRTVSRPSPSDSSQQRTGSLPLFRNRIFNQITGLAEKNMILCWLDWSRYDDILLIVDRITTSQKFIFPYYYIMMIKYFLHEGCVKTEDWTWLGGFFGFLDIQVLWVYFNFLIIEIICFYKKLFHSKKCLIIIVLLPKDAHDRTSFTVTTKRSYSSELAAHKNSKRRIETLQ